MADQIGNLNLRISANADDLQRGFRSATDELNRFATVSQSTARSVRSSAAEAQQATLQRSTTAFATAQDRLATFLRRDAGQQAQLYSEAQSRIGSLLNAATTQSGALSLFDQIKSSLSEMAITAAAAAGPVGTVATIAASGFVAAAFAIRSVTKELSDLQKFSQRIGATTFQAQVALRVFERGGLSRDEAEFTINRFADRLGDLRRNPNGESATTFRRIGLNPADLIQQSAPEALRSVIEAIGRIPDTTLRASYAQAIFGRQWQELTRIIQRANQAFREAEESVRQVGFSDAAIDRAAQAERRWRQITLAYEDDWRFLKSKFADGATWIASLFQQDTWMSSSVAWAVRIGSWVSPTGRIIEGLNQIRNWRMGSSDATPQLATPPSLANGAISQALGTNRAIVDMNASLEDSERLWQIVFNRPRPPALPGAEAQVNAENRVQAMNEEIRANARLRNEAIFLGLARTNATRQEIEAVRDLVAARQRAIDEGRTEEQLAIEDQTRRLFVAQRHNQALEDAIDQLERQQADRFYTPGEARVRDFAQQPGIDQNKVERLRTLTLKAEQRERSLAAEQRIAGLLRQNRPAIETFREQLAEIATALADTNISQEDAETLFGNAFANLERALGPGPQSFAITGIDPRSMEGARLLADAQIRGANIPVDPAVRVQRAIEDGNEVARDTLQEIRANGRFIQANGLAVRGDF